MSIHLFTLLTISWGYRCPQYVNHRLQWDHYGKHREVCVPPIPKISAVKQTPYV